MGMTGWRRDAAVERLPDLADDHQVIDHAGLQGVIDVLEKRQPITKDYVACEPAVVCKFFRASRALARTLS